MKLLDNLVDIVTISGKLRALIRYASDRSEGLQYGSYGLADEVALACSFLKHGGGGAIIDAGANKGDWSCKLLANKACFEKLIIIEPQRIHIPSLQRLSDDNSRVFVEQVAVGAVTAEVNLYADKAGSGLASLYERDLSHIGVAMAQHEVVQVMTLDALAHKHSIQHIAFLKLDLEGHELEALRGANDLLERKAIDAIVFEFGGTSIDSCTYIKHFWSFLVCQHHFTFYRLLPNKRLKLLLRYSESLEQFSWQNILACAPGVIPSWKVLV